MSLHIFSFKCIIDFNTVCYLVLITSCDLNPRFLFRLHDSSVLQSITTFNAKSLCKNLLFGCFFSLSSNSYLCFLYTWSCLIVMTGKFLWPNFSSMCYSFNHNIPIPSTITSMSLFSDVSLPISTILYLRTHKNKIFWWCKCLIIFDCFSLNFLF